MNLLSCLHRLPWHLAAAPAVAKPCRDDNQARGGTDVAADAQPGCGWFDSSHELQQGLLVREHIDPAALAAEMPLGPWLELQLSGWQPALAV